MYQQCRGVHQPFSGCTGRERARPIHLRGHRPHGLHTVPEQAVRHLTHAQVGTGAPICMHRAAQTFENILAWLGNTLNINSQG